ncbi:CoA ester lyase [Methylobacterium sp. E-041]|jgi:citrate lyase subunit beta/citryl-CoA lyase|uniref:HpcH/HpaI aldolase/citrate lyase family protein n=1 Tax=unclassified Methylobacterium TaxID=2615210 RepID=UPI0011CB1D1E|nr:MULTISPECIES: CoA ester lyase [unclassified Methylobacterium]MCJ2008822.1 CoA ester lyase [Methylobacterium sp. J-092]MCJ2038742.1 CoA ester lyase [Methylobacterium sp. J-059]MCJ2078933.1 CoA ester lyase [Methylobacterium sp. E-016]MCJ2109294.1 CoA ester lyase [Methylobacterium sp. E-041]MCJ2111103.1 CoA ester lyase [Methylobacterium sp. E-025]
MSDLRLRRSVLYMPGSNQRALDKAKTLPADCLILDLEDAVSMEEKDLARDQVCAAVKSRAYGDRELIIRVNAPQTPWGEKDLRAAIEARPDAILMPKVSSPAVLESIADHLEALDAPDDIAVWAMIETPAAILNIQDIARASRDRRTRLTCFVLGTNDLAKDTWAQLVPGRVPMLPWMMFTLAAARASGLTILDGVWNDIGDVEGCRAECRQARDLGFDGKTLIHPNQLEPANTSFAPTEEEVRRARLVLEAFDRPENAKRAAIKVENRMYERQHVGMAKRAVTWSEAIKAKGQ